MRFRLTFNDCGDGPFQDLYGAAAKSLAEVRLTQRERAVLLDRQCDSLAGFTSKWLFYGDTVELVIEFDTEAGTAKLLPLGGDAVVSPSRLYLVEDPGPDDNPSA